MGTKYMFKCNKCGYQVMSSGGNDYGSFSVVDTYICTKCKEVVDVCVGEYGQTYTQEEILLKHKSEKELDFFMCPECGSDKNLVKWNKSKRPCPKCDGKMEKDDIVALWD